jgi:hypothetical protein
MMKTMHEAIDNQILHLGSWPPLHHLLQETAPETTRICALLARRPSVGMLIPVLLNIQPHIAHALLEALRADGHIYPATVLLPEQAAAPTEQEQSQEHANLSFAAKIWKHLIAVM